MRLQGKRVEARQGYAHGSVRAGLNRAYSFQHGSVPCNSLQFVRGDFGKSNRPSFIFSTARPGWWRAGNQTGVLFFPMAFA
jgi:hypothetical protein